MNSLRLALDGGAATGKSTVSKLVVEKLGIRYINTGQMYRLFALVAIKENIVDDEKAIYEKIKDFAITYNKEGEITTPDYTFEFNDINLKQVGAMASVVAAMPLVREVATEKQKLIAQESGVLIEGRDIGTVIMPDADFKFFIKVKPEVAAERRVAQHKSLGEEVKFEDILKDINERNERDANREIAPLKPTDESIIIDTSFDSAEVIANNIIKIMYENKQNDEVDNG